MARTERRHRGWTSGIWSFVCSLALGLVCFATLQLERTDAPLLRLNGPQSDWAAQFPHTIERVTNVLAQLPLQLPAPRIEPQGSGTLRWMRRNYELNVPAPQELGTIEDTFAPVRAVAPNVDLHVLEDASGAQVQIGVDGLLTHTLSLHWLGHRPRAAIIIDNLGDDLLVARDLIAMDVPLTFGVLPFKPFAKEVAELANHFGREVLLQLPIETDGTGDGDGPEVLRLSASRDEIVRGVEHALSAVPRAAGANSQIPNTSTDREPMRWLLERVKEGGLFFVDARPSIDSFVCETAASMNLPCATCDLSLDEADDEAAVQLQMESLLTLVRTRGDAIAIGHPRPATLAALRASLGRFAQSEVELVSVSLIVADQSLSRR